MERVIKDGELGRRLCLVLVVLAAFVAGCGGGSSDESEIEATLTSYLNGFASGNGKDVCEAMTRSESRKVTKGFGDSEPAMRSLSCPEAMTKLSEDLGAPLKKAVEQVEIGEIKVSGTRATAEIGGVARLEKIDGSWYITGGGPHLQIIH